VVRERSAKPLCVGSIPTRASIMFRYTNLITQRATSCGQRALSSRHHREETIKTKLTETNRSLGQHKSCCDNSLLF
jgi:hypothetical protein